MNKIPLRSLLQKCIDASLWIGNSTAAALNRLEPVSLSGITSSRWYLARTPARRMIGFVINLTLMLVVYSLFSWGLAKFSRTTNHQSLFLGCVLGWNTDAIIYWFRWMRMRNHKPANTHFDA